MLALDPPSPEATLLLIILSMASHSPCRTQGTSVAIAVMPSIEARTASSGALGLTPLRARGTWPSTAPTLTQRATTIRPAVSPSAVFGYKFFLMAEAVTFKSSKGWAPSARRMVFS